MTEPPTSHAVELEPPAPLPRRRHRWITAPSGIVLAACVALPAVRVCGTPTYPYETPPLVTPYVLGLLVAILALVGARRAVAGLVIAIRCVVWVTVFGWGLFLVYIVFSDAEIVPILVWLAIGAILLGVFGRGPPDERAAIRVTLGTAALGIVWFGLWCFDPNAMFGIYLSAGASIGVLVGGLEWRREFVRDSVPPGVPRATSAP
jgi:hypothetical protein